MRAYDTTRCCHKCRAEKLPGELCFANFKPTAGRMEHVQSICIATILEGSGGQPYEFP